MKRNVTGAFNELLLRDGSAAIWWRTYHKHGEVVRATYLVTQGKQAWAEAKTVTGALEAFRAMFQNETLGN